MGQIILIEGQAGTGKTTRLLAKAKELGPILVQREYQRVLAMSFMHGARRRLVDKFHADCPLLPTHITTIDAFALDIVNRWRLILGFSLPVSIGTSRNSDDSLYSTLFGFSDVLGKAAELLASSSVGRVIGDTFPLVVIDEFQDCDEGHIALIEQLAKYSTLVLAADRFQYLKAEGDSCPALEWIERTAQSHDVAYEVLTTIHRTDQADILQAAANLRSNCQIDGAIQPLICPNAGPAAWKILERLVLGWSGIRWTGSCALLTVKRSDPLLIRTCQSLDKQASDRKYARYFTDRRAGIAWHQEVDESAECEQASSELCVLDHGIAVETLNDLLIESLSPTARQVRDRLLRFAQLKRLSHLPEALATGHIRQAVHSARAFGRQQGKRIITTVHGAKNREFEHVIILWTKSVPPSRDLQRKLLYNAITRAKKDCLLLVIGNDRDVASSPVLKLLGEPLPVFPAR